ncbi:uncharacterized protein LOC133190586 [Saccostrea echinata]|uniref:uncharacterized protein LOC133190586 n=1 Tax=Saccostrea echinata TaxID=191078 RepID=UPI002A80D306|nr:uncharacterized protein LOC133190586 [Saccostrea echinata]
MSVGFSGTQEKNIEPTSGLCVCENISCVLPLHCFPPCSYESDRVYRVKSNSDVYGILGNDSTREMFNALKDEYLGSEYVASVYFDVTGKSFIGIGNPSNSEIIVNIALPEVNNYSLTECMNKVITVNLQSSESKTLNFNCDITGAYINASDNIIAYVASFSSLEQNTASNLQFMVEQLIPVNLWGTRYAVVPYGINAYGDIISIITSQPNTFVHISGYDHVIIPKKYENIRRRIDGKKPVRIRSSKPVSVTQFVLNAAHKSVMVINVPITFTTDDRALNRNSGYNHSYMNVTYEPANDDYAPLTHFFAYREDPVPPLKIFGCSLYKDGMHFRGTFCGFLQSEDSNERHWPLMVPGDGIDNDGNGQTDENDCYTNLWDDSTNPYSSPLESKSVSSNELYKSTLC